MNKSVRKQTELFEWLDALDLPHHFQKFVENGYEDLDICTEIGDSDLHAIGVSDIHERLSLLSAVRNLRHVPKELNSSHNNNYSEINYARDRPEVSGRMYDPYLDEEPFYESVSPISQHDSYYCCDTPNRFNNEIILRSRLREQLARDNIDLSLVVEEVRLRGLAAQYATHWASSSCTGWSSGDFPSPSDLFLQQELLFHQLRALWLEQRQKSSAHNLPKPEEKRGGEKSSGPNASRHLVNNANNGSLQGSKGRSAEHPHQYLQHVIISQMNEREREQIYTPGIYLPSSCLRDKDDIYDYAPPLTRNYTSPAKRSAFSAQLKKSKSNLNSYGRKRGSSPGRRSFNISTIRTSKSSYAVSSSKSCANIISHHNSITQFNPEPSPQHSVSESGCRTLANLSKLGKRLGGLGRFFRTLKIQGASEVGSCRDDHSEPPIYLTHSQSQGFLPSYPTPLSTSNKSKTLETLPSNEKIIETINRLKYEELQKRKERIAKEHQMILKELKVSLSPNSNSTSDGPSSVFYVSPNSNVTSSENVFEEEDGKIHNYDDPPYEIEDMRQRDSLENSRKPKRNEENGGRKRRTSSAGNLWQLFSNSPPKNSPFRGDEGDNTRADSPHGSERIRASSRTSSSSESYSDGFPRNLLRKFNKPKITSSEDLVFPSSSSFSGIDKENRGSQTEHNEKESPEDSPGKTLLGRVKDFHRNTFSTSHRKGCASNNGSSSDLYRQQHVESEVGMKAAVHDVFSSNSSEEELSSIPSDQQGYIAESSNYTGPFVGKAVAIVDCTPSAYDHRALRYKKGDVIEIISKKPTGLWRGKVGNMVGDFKFINVQVLPEERSNGRIGVDGRRRRLNNQTSSPLEIEHGAVINDFGPDKEQDPVSRNTHSQFDPYKREEKRRSESLKRNLPSSLRDLLHRFNLEEHISVFILHGFESLDLFKELEEEDLDRLGFMNPSERYKILAAVELIRELDSPPGSHKASQFSRFPRDSGVFVKCEDEGTEELILSPQNLNLDYTILSGEERRKPTMRNSYGGNTESYNYQLERNERGKSNGQIKVDEFVEVRQRFLQARSMFENGNSGSKTSKGGPSPTTNKFIYCEKSSDSGISTGSPPPQRI